MKKHDLVVGSEYVIRATKVVVAKLIKLKRATAILERYDDMTDETYEYDISFERILHKFDVDQNHNRRIIDLHV
jgi:hypothetical protein